VAIAICGLRCGSSFGHDPRAALRAGGDQENADDDCAQDSSLHGTGEFHLRTFVFVTDVHLDLLALCGPITLIGLESA